MRLASIINTWSDTIELLPYCIANHLQFADAVIVVWSQYSNYGNKDDSVLEYIAANGHDYRVKFEQLEPMKGYEPLVNETRKRNHGLDIARRERYTHFIISDADEFYIPEEIENDKKRFLNPNLNGLVSGLKVYVGSPTYWCNDHTLVPTIHKLDGNVSVGRFREYPFAYDGQTAKIDPSRRPSYYRGIEVSETVMHHFSYVRKDINLKINNSSANLKRSKSVILEELRDAKPGYVSRLYHQELKECPNYFNIQI